MERIGVRELRQNASVYLERVKKGESIEVTERGIPVAVLSPAPALSLLDRLVAEGQVSPARGEVTAWLADNPPIGPAGLSAVVQQMRDEDDR